MMAPITRARPLKPVAACASRNHSRTSCVSFFQVNDHIRVLRAVDNSIKHEMCDLVNPKTRFLRLHALFFYC